MKLLLRSGQFMMVVAAPFFLFCFFYGLYTGVESVNWVVFDYVACISSLVIGGMACLWAAPFWDYQNESVGKGRHQA